jgi:hypothetical protein
MATRKNSTKNLFIKQGDNSNFDLFMKSPEFIKDFTNWESKTSSLEVTRSRAFEKTPFDLSADEMTDYTNIEIGNSVALCADENYTSTKFGDSIFTRGGEGYYIKKTISGYPENETYENPDPLNFIDESPIIIPIDTIAKNSKLHLDTCKSRQNERKLAFCRPPLYAGYEGEFVPGVSNPVAGSFNKFGAGFPLDEDVWAQNLDIGDVPREYEINGNPVIVRPYTKTSYSNSVTYQYYSCSDEGATLLSGVGGSEIESAGGGLIYLDEKDGFVYFLDITGLRSGINIVNENDSYFVIPGTANSQQFPMSTAKRNHLGKDGTQIALFEFTREGVFEIPGLGKIKDPEYKVELFKCNPNFTLFDVTRHEGCGRVDIFNRRSGTLTVNAANNTVSLSDILQGGDLIKVTSALNESTGSSDINSVNGVFYYGSDRKLYTDADLGEEVELSAIRGTATWVLLDSTNSEDPTSRWAYNKSIIGRNVPSDYDETSGFAGDSTDVKSVQTYAEVLNRVGSRMGRSGTNNDELMIREKNFNLGKAIAIRKSDDAIAISQPANHFNTVSEAQTKSKLYEGT